MKRSLAVRSMAISGFRIFSATISSVSRSLAL
jgi:hypothetical protein